MGKYRILKPANPVFGLIMERLHHLEGVELGSVFVSLALRTDNSNVHQVNVPFKIQVFLLRFFDCFRSTSRTSSFRKEDIYLKKVILRFVVTGLASHHRTPRS